MDESDILGWTKSLTIMKRLKMKIYHWQMRRLLVLKMAKRARQMKLKRLVFQICRQLSVHLYFMKTLYSYQINT